MQFESLTDGELIAVFLDEREERAFDTLLRRHYQRLYKRFNARLRDADKAHDLCQTLWMRVLTNLPKYKDGNKFEHYLNTIASNLLKDHWRGDKSSLEASLYDDEGVDITAYTEVDTAAQNTIDPERQFINKQAVDTLVGTLIPALPCDQRLVYLLRHESEYWDDQQPLQWQHLAELNALEVDEACRIFQQARDKLVKGNHVGSDAEDLDCLENLIFLLWTQSQRVDKKQKLTEQYFADLLDMPVNSFKTKYRASMKVLGEGMEKWR